MGLGDETDDLSFVLFCMCWAFLLLLLLLWWGGDT